MRQPVLFLLVLLLAACSSNPTTTPDAGPPDAGPPIVLEDGGMVAPTTRAEVVNAAGDCQLATLKEAQTAFGALTAATAASVATPTAETLTAARDAWKEAMVKWQVIEAMQFGPAASSLSAGGQDLRDQVYSWPLVSRCAVEEQVVSKGYENGVASMLVNRRGLAAAEYLLFYEGDDTACTAASAIVSSGSWAALSTAERATRKRAYAAAVATDVKVRIDGLVSAWEGGFLQTFKSAGPGNPTYASPQLALNAVSDGIFYIEASVKDAKLARPLGLRDCATAPCPELLESQFAGHNLANLRANLTGVRKLLQGCGPAHEGKGFDDLLITAGATELSNTMVAELDGIAHAIDAIEEGDLKPALTADQPSVRALYDATKDFTDLLKTQFITVLDLDIPQGLEGDND